MKVQPSVHDQMIFPAKGFNLLIDFPVVESVGSCIFDFKTINSKISVVFEAFVFPVEPMIHHDSPAGCPGDVHSRGVGKSFGGEFCFQTQQTQVVGPRELLTAHHQWMYFKVTVTLFVYKIKGFVVIVVIGDKECIKAVSPVPFPELFLPNEPIVAVIGMAVGSNQDHILMRIDDGIPRPTDEDQ